MICYANLEKLTRVNDRMDMPTVTGFEATTSDKLLPNRSAKKEYSKTDFDTKGKQRETGKTDGKRNAYRYWQP